MVMFFILILLIVAFSGGGHYYGRGQYRSYGFGVGGILFIVLIILFLSGSMNFGSMHFGSMHS